MEWYSPSFFQTRRMGRCKPAGAGGKGESPCFHSHPSQPCQRVGRCLNVFSCRVEFLTHSFQTLCVFQAPNTAGLEQEGLTQLPLLFSQILFFRWPPFLMRWLHIARQVTPIQMLSGLLLCFRGCKLPHRKYI